MIAAGLFAALCQFAAHHLMRDRPAYIPRYVVGSAIVLACFAAAWLIESNQNPITALTYLYFASYVGTRLGYATDPKPQPRAKPSAEEIEKWASPIAAEHHEPKNRY